ncbi:hypothetical protein F4809DRAFT_651839 [Biscogniauxia mediterranea]|nr:hypothetical protein F4809DRAFT_651839 [Biscogniauxia mediterranea]
METATQSFASRRPAAGGLPQFHLPPPNPPSDAQIPSMADSNFFLQYPSPPTSSPSDSRQETSSPYQHTFSHLVGSKHLTSSPGVTGSDGLSPLSSSVNSASSQSSQAGVTSYNSHGNWSMPGPAYTYGSMTHGGQPTLMQPNYNRPVYSPPGGGYAPRNSQSPATADGLNTSYDNVGPTFPLQMPGSSSGHSSMLSQSQHQQHLHNPILSSQASHPPTPSTTAPPDNYPRAPPTPNYYSAPSSTPQQTSYPSFTSAHPSPPQTSPSTTSSLSRGIPSLSSQPSPLQVPPNYARGGPFGYSPMPPAMTGAVLSNMTNPGGQVSLIGGINSMSHGYHPAHHLGPPHAMYGHAPQNNQQDRPFKCDVCPQSFSRNHDLKRHKRIHLAVKPFPCDHCEKAFSRKDALKRHRLVKGCGNGKTSPINGNDGSPRDDLKSDPEANSNASGGLKEEPL